MSTYISDTRTAEELHVLPPEPPGPAGGPTLPPPSPADIGERRSRWRRDVVFLLGSLAIGSGAAALLVGGVLSVVVVGAGLTTAVVYALPLLAFAWVIMWAAGRLLHAVVPAIGRTRPRSSPLRAGRRVAAVVVRPLVIVLVWWLLCLRGLARRGRSRVAAHVGHPIHITYRPLPHGRSSALPVLLTDPATWRDLTYLAMTPAAVVAVAGLGGLIWMGGVATVLSPLTFGTSLTNQTTWFAISGGITMVLLAPVAIHVLTRVLAAAAVSLLSPGEGARMRAEVVEQRLRRQLAVDAGERERRRIERDLHDGAQQRLVALGITLGLARDALPADPATGGALVDEAHEQAKLALSELRDLARGIHPAILGDRGLDAALSELVRRTPIPASILVSIPTRPPTAVESAAYFVVSEALTNISRHAGASRITISITSDGTWLVVEVTDDGVGGADPALGTGLAGLSDRVEALEGHLTVDSPLGGPTTITAAIPCGS